jgi:hypothetical protein
MNKILLLTVLAFTVFACAKDEVKPKQFNLFGKWRSEKFYDNVFEMDSAVDVYELRPDSTYLKTMYRSGDVLGIQSGKFSIKTGEIKFSYGVFTYTTNCFVVDENTTLLQYYNGDWLTLHKE